MERLTIKQLRALARSGGMRGYSRLRRVEGINLLDAPVGRLIDVTRNTTTRNTARRNTALRDDTLRDIMDKSVPNTNQPVLQPTLFIKAEKFLKSLKDLAGKATKKGAKAAIEFADSVIGYVPPPPRSISLVVEWFNRNVRPLYRRGILQPVEGELVARGALRTFTIDGHEVTTLERYWERGNET